MSSHIILPSSFIHSEFHMLESVANNWKRLRHFIVCGVPLGVLYVPLPFMASFSETPFARELGKHPQSANLPLNIQWLTMDLGDQGASCPAW